MYFFVFFWMGGGGGGCHIFLSYAFRYIFQKNEEEYGALLKDIEGTWDWPCKRHAVYGECLLSLK